MIEMTQKEIQLQSKPWINKNILNMIKEREKIYKMYLKTKDPTLKQDFHKKFKELRNKTREASRLSQKEYLQNFFAKNINNIKKTWKGIKSVININTSNRNQPSSLMVNSKLVTEPKQVAETFNEYFTTIAENFKIKLNMHQETSHHFFKIQILTVSSSCQQT